MVFGSDPDLNPLSVKKDKGSETLVKSWINLLNLPLIGLAANQELAYLLTQLLTRTTTHNFPSQGVGDQDLREWQEEMDRR